MDFFTAWYTFNSRFDECNFSPLTQLVGYKLLTVYGSERCPESFSLTDRELQLRTGIKSISSIVEARRHLKNAGLIDFKAYKAAPVRYVIVEQESSKIDNPIEQESSKNRANGLVPYTLHADEAAAATGAKGFPPAPPFPKTNKQTNTGTRGNEGGDSNTLADAKPLRSSSPDPNDIQDVWTKAIGYDLRGNRALALEQLATEDYERAEEAISRTAKQNAKTKGGLDDEFRYFKAVYDGLRPTKAGKPLTANTQPRQIDEYKLPEESDKDIRTLYANADW